MYSILSTTTESNKSLYHFLFDFSSYKVTKFQVSTKVTRSMKIEEGHLKKHLNNFITNNEESIESNTDFIVVANNAAIQWNSKERLIDFHQSHYSTLELSNNMKKTTLRLERKYPRLKRNPRIYTRLK